MSTQENQTAEIVKKNEERLIVHDDSQFATYLDTAKFNQMWRVATVLSRSKMVPEIFQGKPDDCFIVAQMAMRVGMEPMSMLQKAYVIQGRPAFEATIAIALVNKSGKFTGPLRWKMTGEGMNKKCVCYAYSASDGVLCESEVSMAMAKAEGWMDKRGSKWNTIPEVMLQYRSASFFAKMYAPELTMGFTTIDEAEDIAGTTKYVQNENFAEVVEDSAEEKKNLAGSQVVDAEPEEMADWAQEEI